MTQREKLADAARLIAWGYVLLHVNISFWSVNILPNWLGYALMLHALPALGEEEPSALLLRPLGMLLALWEGLLWALAIFGGNADHVIIGVLGSVVALYFHFQLLTNLASIAERYGCPEQNHILTLRTVRTVLITLLALPLHWERYEVLAGVIVLVHLIVAFWICLVLFSLKRSLLENEAKAAGG